jgi:hypothetical protein
MTPQQAADLIDLLKLFASRPGMFVGKSDVLLAQVFLEGFMAALQKALRVDMALFLVIAVERGWRKPKASEAFERQMLEAGMSAEQVIAEMVAIEIEVIQRSTVTPA